MNCNGCQTVRTGSECNFLNEDINLILRLLLLPAWRTFESAALIEAVAVYQGPCNPTEGECGPISHNMMWFIADLDAYD